MDQFPRKFPKKLHRKIVSQGFPMLQMLFMIVSLCIIQTTSLNTAITQYWKIGLWIKNMSNSMPRYWMTYIHKRLTYYLNMQSKHDNNYKPLGRITFYRDYGKCKSHETPRKIISTRICIFHSNPFNNYKLNYFEFQTKNSSKTALQITLAPDFLLNVTFLQFHLHFVQFCMHNQAMIEYYKIIPRKTSEEKYTEVLCGKYPAHNRIIFHRSFNLEYAVTQFAHSKLITLYQLLDLWLIADYSIEHAFNIYPYYYEKLLNSRQAITAIDYLRFIHSGMFDFALYIFRILTLRVYRIKMMTYYPEAFVTQQTWSGFSPTAVPDNNRQSGFSPTTVPKLSTGN